MDNKVGKVAIVGGGRNAGKTFQAQLKWLEELQEYKQLEEQGLLHKAPIPNGTTIYVWQMNVDDEWFIHSESYLYGVTEYFYGKLGEDFWTTKEEAEWHLQR